MRLFVLARNHQQFKEWCWSKGFPSSHATYVANVERLRGATFTPNQIIALPGAHEHPEFKAIMEHVNIITAIAGEA